MDSVQATKVYNLLFNQRFLRKAKTDDERLALWFKHVQSSLKAYNSVSCCFFGCGALLKIMTLCCMGGCCIEVSDSLDTVGRRLNQVIEAIKELNVTYADLAKAWSMVTAYAKSTNYMIGKVLRDLEMQCVYGVETITPPKGSGWSQRDTALVVGLVPVFSLFKEVRISHLPYFSALRAEYLKQ